MRDTCAATLATSWGTHSSQTSCGRAAQPIAHCAIPHRLDFLALCHHVLCRVSRFSACRLLLLLPLLVRPDRQTLGLLPVSLRLDVQLPAPDERRGVAGVAKQLRPFPPTPACVLTSSGPTCAPPGVLPSSWASSYAPWGAPIQGYSPAARKRGPTCWLAEAANAKASAGTATCGSR